MSHMKVYHFDLPVLLRQSPPPAQAASNTRLAYFHRQRDHWYTTCRWTS